MPIIVVGIFSNLKYCYYILAEERAERFPRKDVKSINHKGDRKQISLLTELLAKFPNMPENPFRDFAKMDGNVTTNFCFYSSIHK